MNSKKLEAIAARAAEDLPAFISEAEEEILKAWASVIEQADLDEGKPKLKLSFAISLDLEKFTMDTTLSFGVTRKLSRSGPMPDPTQPELPIDDTTITIAAPGHTPVTMSGEKFGRVCAELKNKKDK